jgi:hypothetical protein
MVNPLIAFAGLPRGSGYCYDAAGGLNRQIRQKIGEGVLKKGNSTRSPSAAAIIIQNKLLGALCIAANP